MGLTLSTQVSLDYDSAEDFIEKARLHVLASPVVAALSVNSPIADGALCGVLPGACSTGRNSIRGDAASSISY